MTLRFKYLLFGLAFFVSFCANGQILKGFSGDPQVFIQEVQEAFTHITNKDILEKVQPVLTEFVANWMSMEFSQEDKAMIMQNVKLLETKRIKAYPELFQYLATINSLNRTGDREAIYTWSSSMNNDLADMSFRMAQDYIDKFYNFFSFGVLAKTSSYVWKVTDSSFLFQYDTVPKFYFKQTDLVCTSGKDSSVIHSTSGVYLPTEEKWVGEKGKVLWQRFNISEDTIQAIFRDYSIDLNFSNYSVDSIIFFNRRYFKEPLLGRFEDKVSNSAPNKSTSYPRFDSYLKNYEIRNLFRNIDYLGGLTMHGVQLIGSGAAPGENASITISRKGKKIFQFYSLAFFIQGDRISSNPASMVILLGNDSIYHPGIQMKYLNESREISLYRPPQGISESPFFDYYHDVDIDCKALYWNIDENKVEFGSLKAINRNSEAEFVSNYFFSKRQFDRIQGIDNRNPLYVIRKFGQIYSTDEITPGMLAEYMRMPEEQVKAMMIRLSIMGFLSYDLTSNRATIQERLYHFIEANVGDTDYDVIRISSETNNVANAELNLDNYDLLLRGVSEVFLSDSQNVYIYPEKREILMKKGFDFVFTGRVKAGLFEFYPTECSFEYDSFRLNMPVIDSLSFQVESFEKNDQDEYYLKRVNNVIEDLSGRILIDEPNNKSGLKDFPRYPVFVSDKESYVYYDKNPLYKRDSFKYRVEPFEIDSLDNFTTENLKFDGTLTSAGIFPDLQEPLKVQPDYSLGFISDVPEDGYPVYGGKGRFYNKIDLSNQGLRAKGRLKYLTTTSVSDDFIFYPERMNARPVNQIQVAERGGPPEYPKITADTVNLAWFPYRDSMIVKQMKGPMSIFRDQALLNGEFTYTDEGVTGKGKLEFEKSTILADDFRFGRLMVESDSADFTLLGEEPGKPAVSMIAFQAKIDFSKRKAEFVTNERESQVAFPYNQFISTLETINWQMDDNEMVLRNDQSERFPGIDQMTKEQLIDLKSYGTDMVSTNPEMDSLTFSFSTARYDVKKLDLIAEDVKLIKVADAAIFPDSGIVKIGEGGRIETFRNADIIADTNGKYHHFYNAYVDIFSRKNYEAKGTYQYRGIRKRYQELPFDLIAVDTTGRTYAVGSVKKENGFWLSPSFAFVGHINIFGDRPALDFEGGFQTTQNCFNPVTDDWIYFHDEIDPKDVKIPIGDPPVTMGGDEHDAALYISDYDDEIYLSFFDKWKVAGDTAIIRARGNISYDTLTKTYRIFEGEKYDPATVSDYFFFNTRQCAVRANGLLNLGVDYSYVDITSTGQIDYFIIPDSADLKLTLAIDFYFDDKIMGMMTDSLVQSNLKGIELMHPRFRSVWESFLGEQGASEMQEELGIYGTFRKVPNELEHTIVLTDLNLFWSSVTKSYVSRGPIGILNINKDPVVRYVNGYVELLKRRSGDGMTLYLEKNPLNYYFFDYRFGVMQVMSSDETFNTSIEEMKENKRTDSKPGVEENYEYVLSTRRKVIDFIRRMESVSR